MHKYKIGDEFIFKITGERRTITEFRPVSGRYVVKCEGGSSGHVDEQFIDAHYTPIKKESDMSDFKYEVGDMFDLGTKRSYNTREIVARFTAVDGENRYVIRYFSDGKHRGADDEIQTEGYIDNAYIKIEPFFEVGKTYRHEISSNKYKCIATDEGVEPKRAWLRGSGFQGYASVPQGDFGYYEEVK